MDNEKDYIGAEMAEANAILDQEDKETEEFVCIQDADVIGYEGYKPEIGSEYLDIANSLGTQGDLITTKETDQTGVKPSI